MCFLQIIIIHYLFHQFKKVRENSFSSSSFSFPDTFISPASQLSSSSKNRRKILHFKHCKFFPLSLSSSVHFFAGSWIQRTDGPNGAVGASLWKQGVGVVGELGLGLGSHCTEKAEKKCVLNPSKETRIFQKRLDSLRTKCRSKRSTCI